MEESPSKDVDRGEAFDRACAYASGSVLTAVAALEAYINELYEDYQSVFPDFRPKVMAKVWEHFESKSILDKLEFALLLCNGGVLTKGANPYQAVTVLIDLRNALTHYKPEWSDERLLHEKVTRSLQHRATPSPLLPLGTPLFPRGWASSGTAKWAVESVALFIADFEQRANLTGMRFPQRAFERIRTTMETYPRVP